MKTKPLFVAAIFFVSSFCPFVSQLASSEPPTGNVVLLSDIHFDPLADSKIVSDLIKKDASEWKATFESSELFKKSGYQNPGEDTNYVLLNSAILAVCDQKPFDFVVVSGDCLRHSFLFEFKNEGLQPTDFPAFATKTAVFVIERLQKAFGVPVFVALGNDDSDIDDYKMAPGGSFLKDVAASLHVLAGAPQAAADFRIGGYYELPHPTLPDVEIIVLNSVLWSPRFEDCRTVGDRPGTTEMEWLGTKLAEAKASAKKVILILHIPPGIDAYAKDKYKKVTPFWCDIYFDRFLELMESYGDIVQIALAGHTHMDDFRVLHTSDAARSVAFRITPSLTPKFGNNPAFSVLHYNGRTGDISDITTFNLDLANRGGAAKWSFEYCFPTVYGYSMLTASNLAALTDRIRTDQHVRETFELYYAASAPSPITSDNWRIYSCTQTRFTPDEFSSCVGKE
jgi:sphingomyelin phosphodiesterase acid-like 3